MGDLGLSLITSSQLAMLLDNSNQNKTPLVIDCRSFTLYNSGHITGSHNIYCPPILKRRCGDGIPLQYIVRAAEVREGLIRGDFERVVLVDEGTKTLETLEPQSDVRLAYNALQKCSEKLTTSVQLLKGGFDAFSLVHRRFCTWSGGPSGCRHALQLSLSSPEMIRGLSQAPSLHLIGPLSAGRQPPLAPFRCLTNSQEPFERSSCTNNERVEDDPDEIRPWLYLGTMQQAGRSERLARLGITSLLNMAGTTASLSLPGGNLTVSSPKLRASTNDVEGAGCGSNLAVFDTEITRSRERSPCQSSPGQISRPFTCMTVPLKDNATADISTWFPSCIKFIEDTRRSGGKVLVHCQAGISRSATMVIAYLMQIEGLTMDSAHDLVKSRRSIIAPNLNFMRQLYEFEAQLRRRQLAVVTAIATPRFTRGYHRYRRPSGTSLTAISPCTPDSATPRSGDSLFNFENQPGDRRMRPPPTLPFSSPKFYQKIPSPGGYATTSSFSLGLGVASNATKSAILLEKSRCMFDLSRVVPATSSTIVHCPPIIPSQ